MSIEFMDFSEIEIVQLEKRIAELETALRDILLCPGEGMPPDRTVITQMKSYARAALSAGGKDEK
jgi:hypothetical protein